MAKKTLLNHVEFNNFKELANFYLENETLKSLPENGWGVVRVQYPKGYLDNYYVIAAVDATAEHVEIPGLDRSMILIENCSEHQRAHIDKMAVREQPGEPTMTPEEMDIVIDLIDESSSYLECESLEDVLDHFDSQVQNFEPEEWAVHRLNYEHPDYPDSYIFLAINTSVDEYENIGIRPAVLAESKCSPEDHAFIRSIPVEEVSDENDDAPVEPTVPTWDGHTIH